MLTKIVETNEKYQVGIEFKLDGKAYTIQEVETIGDLTRLWLA